MLPCFLNFVLSAIMNLNDNYFFELPNLNASFSKCYTIWLSTDFVFLLPKKMFVTNCDEVKKAGDIYINNRVIGDCMVIEIVSNNSKKINSLIRPILLDYSHRNNVEFNLEFYE